MKVTKGKIALIGSSIFTGSLLIFAGSTLGWGLTWILAGVFFITIGISAGLLTLAWILPNPLGKFLRHPIVNIVILVSVVVMMLATLVVGIFFQGH